MTMTLRNHAEQYTADPSRLPEGFIIVPAPYGKDVVDANDNKMSHVFDAGVEQGVTPFRDETLGENLRTIVGEFPPRDAVADVYANVSFTFGRSYNQVLRLTSAFIHASYRPGDHTGIWSINHWEWTVMQYVCHHIGLVLVNINPVYHQHELSYVLEGVGVCMVSAIHRCKDSGYRTTLTGASKQCGVRLNKVIYLGSPEWYEYMYGKIDNLSGYASQLKPDDPTNIQFTSNTTGFPKGATLACRNLLNNGYFIGELLGYIETDRTCVPVPFFHTFGMVIGTFMAFTYGAAIVAPAPSFKARETLKAMYSIRVTSLYGVPTMLISEFEEIRDQKECGPPYDLSMFRTGMMAGASYPSKIMCNAMDKLSTRGIVVRYGMTEIPPVSFQTRADSPLEKHVNIVGQVVPHLEARIVCEEADEMLPRGEQDEVVIRGYPVMEEYWKHPEKTAEATDVDGWMHTGDLSMLDDEGYLPITGRVKDILIRGGENIYPHEIREFLFTHLAAVDAQVVGVPDGKYGREIMAWVILHDDVGDPIAEDVAAFAHGKPSRHKIPCYVHIVEGSPMTMSGEVRKAEMREMVPRIPGQVQDNVKSN